MSQGYLVPELLAETGEDAQKGDDRAKKRNFQAHRGSFQTLVQNSLLNIKPVGISSQVDSQWERSFLSDRREPFWGDCSQCF